MKRVRLAGLTALCVVAGSVGAQVAPAPRPVRLLGAYDLTSGEPIEGAKVADYSTGSYVLTSRTGTAS